MALRHAIIVTQKDYNWFCDAIVGLWLLRRRHNFPIFKSKFKTCWSICIAIYLTFTQLEMQGCGEGGGFNILAIVVPQNCDGIVGICANADTISPSLKANLELVDQQSVGAACISNYFYITQLKMWNCGGGVCFNILLLYFLSPHSRVHCFTVCDFLTVRKKCQKNWTNVTF